MMVTTDWKTSDFWQSKVCWTWSERYNVISIIKYSRNKDLVLRKWTGVIFPHLTGPNQEPGGWLVTTRKHPGIGQEHQPHSKLLVHTKRNYMWCWRGAEYVIENIVVYWYASPCNHKHTILFIGLLNKSIDFTQFVVRLFHLDEYDSNNSKGSSATREMKGKSIDPFDVSCLYVSKHTSSQLGLN